jgi:uncharacterized protein YfaS (alpha-2-macroglobulin family)
MMWHGRDRVRFLVLAAVLSVAVVSVSSQSPQLSITSASPRGDLAQRADAGDIRIVFSEPMIALGAAPSGSAPPWFHITPAIPGSFYWSGAKTLIFSPDASTPLPYATTFSVRVDGTATSVSGHALGKPYLFRFTTPTVRMLGTEWYRRDDRFDRPAVIVLQFNQPVRPADVVSHTRVALVPHAWTAPLMSTAARERLRRIDPAGLRRFDEKVAATRRETSRAAAVEVHVADSWDLDRFPAKPEQVVLETDGAPPTAGWLRITLDATLPSPDGPQTRGPQSTTVELEPTFFVSGAQCARSLPSGSIRWSAARARAWRASHQFLCRPAAYSPILLTHQVAIAAFARALTVVDATDPAAERPVAAIRGVDADHEPSTSPTIEDAGFPRVPPVRAWRLQLAPELQATDGQTLGYPWVGFVETSHEDPFVALDGMVWEAGGDPRVLLNARNVQSITQRIARMPPDSIVPRLRELEDGKPSPPPAAAAVTRRLAITPDVVATHGLDTRQRLSPADTGLLWMDVAAAELLPGTTPQADNEPGSYGVPRVLRTLLQVTNLGITVKDSPASTLVFVTRLDTGVPVPDARVTIMDADNQTRWRGATDRDGVALAPGLELRRLREDWKLSFVVTAEKDGDVAFVGSNWSGGAREHMGGHATGEGANVLRGSLFTDRGVYKVREDVHLKAVLRDDTPSGMRTLPPETALDIVVRDGRGREIDRRRITTSRWSSAEWIWRVPEDGALGHYSVELTRASAAPRASDEPFIRGFFRVEAFARPDFRVDATLTALPAVLGSTLRGRVGAAYLFGGVFDARPVRWSVSRQPIQSAPDAIRETYPDTRYGVGYLPDWPDWKERQKYMSRTQDTGVLDATGHLSVPISTAAESDMAYSYVLEADVESVSGRHVANRASLVVHPAALYVAVARPPMFVDTKTGATVGIAAVDLTGRPVGDVPVTVSLLREEWVRKSEKNRSGSSEWIRREIPAGEWTVRSGAGETPLPIPVSQSGSYVVRAIARDGAGRQTRTEIGFYALGPGPSSWHGDEKQVDLTPERKTWKPGEKARILIHSPWPHATGLVTVEREGIRSHRTFTIGSTQDTVEVPVTEADVPNMYVSVVLVKGRTSTELGAGGTDTGRPEYRVGYTELTVDDSSKRLSVKVSADRDEYRPRQPLNVSVAVAGPDGRPVAGEVTLWAVDYGLVSLTGYTTPDLLRAIYVPKALQVATADNRARLRGRGVMEGPLGIPGGVLGGVIGGLPMAAPAAPPPSEDAGVSADDEVRQDFRPLVFWLGSAATGPDGRVTTTVTLPDSLTTYRIMAVAANELSQFGSGELEIRVNKPLTLLTAFPRFLGEGDRASFGAVVTNGGKTAGTAVVTVLSLDQATLQFSAVRQDVRLAPGASQSIKFDAVAMAAGEARVRITARLGGETDALEMPLTVGRPMRLETAAAYGQTAGIATERLVVPPGVLPGAGGLTVELASTALVGLGESARYLDQYPYDCAEQKASRALALLLASDLGGAFTLPGIEPGQYRSKAASALRELYGYQCVDSGGFALWAGRCGSESAYLTAYVLHVMKTGQTLGVTLDSRAVESALGFLERELSRPPPNVRWWPVWAASHAYSVKVLTEFGRKPRATINQLAGMADRLPVFALSYLADALAASNDKGPRYQDVVRRLTNALRIEADRAHVEEKDDEALAWLWNTNVRATAVVLDGLSRRKDTITPAAPLARWLVAARSNGRWGTTHENAMALEAYYRAFEKDVPQMTAAVTLGTAPVGSATFNGRSTAAQQIQVPMPDLQRRVAGGASSTLSIARSGAGRVHYTARLQYVLPEPAEAVDRGFFVERRYEVYAKDGSGVAATSFAAGDVIRVTVAVTIRGEGRYLALTDPVPAGFEPLADWSLTTVGDLARAATRTGRGDDWPSMWRGGYFDHVEKHDDRVVAFATRLGSGRHEFSYLVRAATAGTFDAPGATVEAMYAPELGGRSQAMTLTVK